jgi:molybdate transport system substrate-binding protein
MRRLALLLLAFMLGSGCRAPKSNNHADTEITISAAASLRDAFDEIGRLYTARTGVKVNFNYGASGLMQKQIEQAAPVDVFASAGEQQMDKLAANGFIRAETRRAFVGNRLVLIVPNNRSNAQQSESAWFDRLAQDSVRKLAVGNPQTVPAGQYAQQTLVSMKLWDKVQPKLVLAEDVRQVLDYVARGEVDAGFVYQSDVGSTNHAVLIAEPAPDATHEPIRYPIAVVKDSRHADEAQQFIEIVLSADGQAILKKYGFVSVLAGAG